MNLGIATKTIRVILASLIIYTILIDMQIYKDYRNYKDKNIQICRYNNVINTTGKICYGNVEQNVEKYWTGNHVWGIKENGEIIDTTCKNCPIIETISCLSVKNGNIEPEYDKVENIVISYYFINLSLLRKFGLIV